MSELDAFEKNQGIHDSGETGAWDKMDDGGFDSTVAEANRAKDSEKMEEVPTSQYEKEIRALGDLFEEPSFLSEPIDAPSDMELVKEWIDKNAHTKEIQEWVQSASSSPEEQAYKKSLASAGFKKKMFYRSDPSLLKAFDEAREDYRKNMIKEKTDEFLVHQDVIERDVSAKLKQYDTEPDNPVSKMEGDNLPLPSRLELVKDWIEGSSSGEVIEHADLIKEWLASDDGDDKEKRYRALIRVKLDGPILRWGRRGTFDEIEKIAVGDTVMPYNLYRTGFYKNKLMSPEYSSLSDEEKLKKWEEAGFDYINKLKEKREREEAKAAARKEPLEGASEKGRNENDEQKPIETTSLPDQGPNPLSPLFNEYPMDPYGTMFS